MSLSLTTSDWMMVTRLIYRINCIEAIDAYPREVLNLLKTVLPFSRGIFNLLQKQEGAPAASSICGLNFPEKELKSVTEQELNSNFFLQSLYFDFSAKVSRGPSLTELNHKEAAGVPFFPDSVQHALTMILQFKEDVLGYLILLRGNQEPEFTRRDMCVLDELHPHISLQLSKLLSRSSSAEAGSVLPVWETLFHSYDLSKKEIEVIYYFYQGLSDAEICQKLFISKSTFKKHVNHIYQKMNLNNRVALLKCVDNTLENAR